MDVYTEFAAAMSSLNVNSPVSLTQARNATAKLALVQPKLKPLADQLIARIDSKFPAGSVTTVKEDNKTSAPLSASKTDEGVIDFSDKWIPVDKLTPFEQIIGYPDVKLRLCKDLMAGLVYPALRGPKKARGVVLYGPGGTGKTELAKAVGQAVGKMTEGRVKFFSVSAADIESKWVGGGVKNMKALLQTVQKASEKDGGAILFMDELDTLLAATDENSQKVINEFKSNYDPKYNVTTIVNTNFPGKFLDGAMKRRLGSAIYVGVPLINAFDLKDKYKGQTALHCGGDWKEFKIEDNENYAIFMKYIRDLTKCGAESAPTDFTEKNWTELYTKYRNIGKLVAANIEEVVRRAQDNQVSGKDTFFSNKYGKEGDLWYPNKESAVVKTWTELSPAERENVCWPGINTEDLAKVFEDGVVPTTSLANLTEYYDYAEQLPDRKSIDRINKDIRRWMSLDDFQAQRKK